MQQKKPDWTYSNRSVHCTTVPSHRFVHRLDQKHYIYPCSRLTRTLSQDLLTGLFLNFDFKVFSNFLSLYNQNSQSQLASLTPDKKLDLVVTQQLTHRLWQMLSFKIVVVGDSGVGKTTLLFANGCNKFDSDVYHLIDTQSIHAMTPDGKPYSYGLWDTVSQEEYDRLRPLQYPNTDVFLVCFSTVVPKSLEKASELELWV